jgi:uncharacterized protein (TIGR00251 family)
MAIPDLPFLRTENTGAVLVHVHVMPNAPKTQAHGLHDGALRVRLKAPPVEGKANLELVAWLARELELPRACIELIRGESGRRKQLRVAQACVANARWERLMTETPDVG